MTLIRPPYARRLVSEWELASSGPTQDINDGDLLGVKNGRGRGFCHVGLIWIEVTDLGVGGE